LLSTREGTEALRARYDAGVQRIRQIAGRRRRARSKSCARDAVGCRRIARAGLTRSVRCVRYCGTSPAAIVV
jgi:hypothetical protein